MSFQISNGAAGMIVLTMSDHESEEFISLAAFEWQERSAFEAAWASVPEAINPGPDAPAAYLADRHGPDGHVDDRYVTSEWIEEITGRPLAEMIAEGRAANAEQLKMLRHRLPDSEHSHCLTDKARF